MVTLNCKRLALLGGTAARTLAGLVGLTPARVDLMVLLLRYSQSQSFLAEALCVHASVVSRLVTALSELGLVMRTVPRDDRRLRMVCLTAAGRRALAPLLRYLPPDGSRGAQCAGESAFRRSFQPVLHAHGVDLRALERLCRPPLRSMRAHNRKNPYRRAFVYVPTCVVPRASASVHSCCRRHGRSVLTAPA